MKICIMSTEKQYETGRIREEAEKRGHSVSVKSPAKFGEGFGFNVLLVRAVMRHTREAVKIAEKARRKGIRVVDERIALIGGRNKYRNYVLFKKAGLFVPRMFMLEGGNACRAEDFGPEDVVVKDVRGKRGRGVYRCKKSALEKFVSSLDRRKKYMVQEFVPLARELRVFVVGKKVLGAFSKETENWKRNIAQGARAVKHEPSSGECEVALKAAGILHTEIAGVDVGITGSGKLFVLEVNRSPLFRGFEGATGVNVALEIVKYLEEKCGKAAKN